RSREGTVAVGRSGRRTLVRRLNFDLLGLPPAPEQIERFLKDESPGAYEKLVDQLLASPHHGERMARHWIDLVHFAETHGHDQDQVRPNAWRYRDYLIESFNADTPYSRFIEEQIGQRAAIDELHRDVVHTAVLPETAARGPLADGRASATLPRQGKDVYSACGSRPTVACWRVGRWKCVDWR